MAKQKTEKELIEEALEKLEGKNDPISKARRRVLLQRLQELEEEERRNNP